MTETHNITVADLAKMAEKMYGGLVKAVVDVAQKKIVVDMEMHVDGEQYFLENGSKQSDLWGINLYPEQFSQPDFIEFDSMINIRPRQNNRSRGVENKKIQQQILEIVNKAVHE